jgi:putative NADH-flavin reductase
MKIALVGATGFVGKAIANELISRNIEVLGISRKETASEQDNLTYKAQDIRNVEELADTLKGYDAVVNAFNPGWTNPDLYNEFLEGSKTIQDAVKRSGVNRYITIGGAGSLYIADGVQLVDTDGFPEEYKSGAKAARDYLNVLKEEKELDWAFFSPAIEMHQGITTGRTGKYRLGGDNPIFNEEQRSILSVEDLAVVIADEVETPKHHQVRFTAAY